MWQGRAVRIRWQKLAVHTGRICCALFHYNPAPFFVTRNTISVDCFHTVIYQDILITPARDLPHRLLTCSIKPGVFGIFQFNDNADVRIS